MGQQPNVGKSPDAARKSACATCVILALCLVGCAKPPHLSAELRLTRPENGAGRLYLRIVNEESRVTTPIQIELRIRPHDGVAPVNVLPIAPFVLNRHETRDITAGYRSDAADVDPKLMVHEGETGRAIEPNLRISYVALRDLIPPKSKR